MHVHVPIILRLHAFFKLSRGEKEDPGSSDPVDPCGSYTQVDQSDNWVSSDPISILSESDRIISDYIGSW